MESYQNPGHTTSNGVCCDGTPDTDGVCTDPCDNAFIFCIQEFTAIEIFAIPENCPFFHHFGSSAIFQDNDNITFSMNEDFGGVSNPLSFTGSGTWQVSQEYIHVLCAGHCGVSAVSK